MDPQLVASLAASITKAASKQTFYTIRYLVDRPRVADAYCAYAYFRWVDDVLDSGYGSRAGRISFVGRQDELLEKCLRGEPVGDAVPEENLLIDLVRGNPEPDSGLQVYLRDMMALMVFDANRRGRIISQAELDKYTHMLASAVTEAVHFFVGSSCYTPHDDTRYQAVTAAHITHMLRDLVDDIHQGYINIPGELLETHRITPQDLQSDALRGWVRERVDLARANFKMGKAYLGRVENLRCKLAGFSYAARFEWLLDTIEREDYLLRPFYSENKSLRIGMRMSWLLFASLFRRHPASGAETQR